METEFTLSQRRALAIATVAGLLAAALVLWLIGSVTIAAGFLGAALSAVLVYALAAASRTGFCRIRKLSTSAIV